MRGAILIVSGALFLLLSAFAIAANFRSVGDNPAILYDAPSEKAKKLYVLTPGYPLEVVVSLEHWSKVRDPSGELSWIENADFGNAHTLMVNVPVADIRTGSDDNAPLAFQAAHGVLLDLLELTDNGWARVKHPDGQTGYIKVDQVWGL